MGLEVGYRWYSAHDVKPAFWFGTGLSYTQFRYTDLDVQGASGRYVVSVMLHNVGQVDGSDVAQAYLRFPTSSGEPPLQLKAFKKSFLRAGSSARIRFLLEPMDFSIWDIENHGWQQQRGTFGLDVGGGISDIQVSTTLFNHIDTVVV